MSRGTKRLAIITFVAVLVTTATAITVFSVSDAGRNSGRGDRDGIEETATTRPSDDRDDRPRTCRSRQGDGNDDDRYPTTTRTPSGQLLPSFLVGLPQVTFLKVDRSGRIIAAATNTSCRPTPGDTVYVTLPNGTIITAPHLDLAFIEWRGSFREPGVYYRQRAQRGCLLPTPCRSSDR
jgi:hypothetical protein